MFCSEGVDYESLENRGMEVVRTPPVRGSIDATGALVPSELASAQTIDSNLAVVYGWRVDSIDPLLGMRL